MDAQGCVSPNRADPPESPRGWCQLLVSEGNRKELVSLDWAIMVSTSTSTTTPAPAIPWYVVVIGQFSIETNTHTFPLDELLGLTEREVPQGEYAVEGGSWVFPPSADEAAIPFKAPPAFAYVSHKVGNQSAQQSA